MVKAARSLAGKLANGTKKAFESVELRYLCAAVITVIFAEILSVGFAGGISYPFRHPPAFICSVLILFSTYSIASFFPCKLGVFIILEGFWLGLAIANKVLLSFRVNPLSAVDFKILRSVFSIITVYLSVLEIVLILASIAAAIVLAVFIMIRLPKKRPDYKKSTFVFLLSAILAVFAVVSTVSFYADGMRRLRLPEVYREYGFVYSLSVSVSDRGIARPDGYSEHNISTIIRPDETETEKNESDPEKSPENDVANVIFVQLESFFDPYLIKNLSLSADPIPNFRDLARRFPSGKLNVPVAGAGTVNTEFEILCGIPISVFGIGEYPYETVLTVSPCESLAYYFREIGMSAHSIHNHTGTFYNRYLVMENLGFDTFTPIEYMSDAKKNMNGWAKDKMLTDEIIGSMQSTDTSDFVYAISVQAHGKYVSVPGDYGDIKVTGEYPEDSLYAMEFYVNQLNETDAFVGELIRRIEELGEDTVIVFFGDHQPSLDLLSDDIKGGSIYETEYVIWSNCGVTAEDKPLDAYRLGSHLLSLLDVEGGVISKFHNGKYGDVTSEENLRDLAYDILMGEMFAYGGSFPYEVPDIAYGWQKLKTSGAYIKNETLYVTGENFTESSVIFVGGRRKDTIFINESLIVTDNISSAADVKVAQVAESGYVFGEVKCKVISEPD